MIAPDHVLDLRGVPVPISLLKVSQVFGEMKLNDILEIRGDDRETRLDLFRVLPAVSIETVNFVMEDPGYRLQIRKTGDS